MTKLIDWVNSFDRRVIKPIYDIQGDLDFACLDKTEIAEDLGFKIEDHGGSWDVVPVRFDSIEAVEAFPWKAPDQAARLSEEAEAVRQWRSETDVLLGGGCFGPITVTACLFGIEFFCRQVRRAPDVVRAVCERVTAYMVRLAELEAPCIDYFWIAEPVASLLAPGPCRDFCAGPIRRIFEASGHPGALHVCGNTDRQIEALLETGAQLLSIDYVTDMLLYLKTVPSDVVVMGNINPMLFWNGTPETVRLAVTELLDTVKDYKNVILSSGCQIPGASPRENVEMMVETVKAYPIR